MKRLFTVDKEVHRWEAKGKAVAGMERTPNSYKEKNEHGGDDED